MLTKAALLVILHVSSITTREWSSAQPELLAGVVGPCDECVDVRECSAAIFASVVTLRMSTCAFDGHVPFVCCDRLKPPPPPPVFTHRPPLQLDNNGISELNPSGWDAFASRHRPPPPVYSGGDPGWFLPPPGGYYHPHGQGFPGHPPFPAFPYGPNIPREFEGSSDKPGGATHADGGKYRPADGKPSGDTDDKPSGGREEKTQDAGKADKRRLLPTECGVTLEERIVGGQEAGLGAFPWVVRIGYTRNGTGPILYRCGGALISDRYVLTAAHCVSALPQKLQLSGVRLGELDERQDPDCFALECADPVQDFTVEEAVVHPGYDNPPYTNDIAVLRLDRPANTNTYVAPICLPLESSRHTNFTGLKATVVGWGATKTDGTSSSPTLRWLRVSVSGAEACRAAYDHTGAVIDEAMQLCAGGAAQEDSCDGDSGGPLSRPDLGEGGVPRHFLLGVVSFGARRCGTPALPGVYTRVATYVPWILDQLRP